MLLEQVTAVPPFSHTDFSFASLRSLPVLPSQELMGVGWLPLLGHEQLGLQQSQ